MAASGRGRRRRGARLAGRRARGPGGRPRSLAVRRRQPRDRGEKRPVPIRAAAGPPPRAQTARRAPAGPRAPLGARTPPAPDPSGTPAPAAPSARRPGGRPPARARHTPRRPGSASGGAGPGGATVAASGSASGRGADAASRPTARAQVQSARLRGGHGVRRLRVTRATLPIASPANAQTTPRRSPGCGPPSRARAGRRDVPSRFGPSSDGRPLAESSTRPEQVRKRYVLDVKGLRGRCRTGGVPSALPD